MYIDYSHNSTAYNFTPLLLENFNEENAFNTGFHCSLGDSISSDENILNETNKEQKFLIDQSALIFNQSTTANNLDFNNILSQNQNQEEKKDLKDVAKDNNENIIDKKNDEKNVENNEFTKKKRERSENNNTVTKEYKKFGRKSKLSESDEKGNHTKYSEDNMITKIKICLINSILFLLNNSFIYFNFNTGSFNNKKFLKIEPNIYSPNKRDDNLLLLKTTVKELLYNNICNKNSKADKFHNKKLIDEIYNQQKEVEVIKLLELTIGEFLDLFRGKISIELEKKLSLVKHVKEKFMNIKDFEDKIRQKGLENGEKKEDIDSYIQKIKDLCLNYENWFLSKKGRERKKGKNIVINV